MGPCSDRKSFLGEGETARQNLPVYNHSVFWIYYYDKHFEMEMTKMQMSSFALIKTKNGQLRTY